MVNKTFRVIDRKTGKEADPYEIALKEEWARGLCYCDMEGFALLEDGSLILLDECGKYQYCDTKRFEVRWDREHPENVKMYSDCEPEFATCPSCKTVICDLGCNDDHPCTWEYRFCRECGQALDWSPWENKNE